MCFTGSESYKRVHSKYLPLFLVPPPLQEAVRGGASLSPPFYTLFLYSPFPSGPSIILAIPPYQSIEASSPSLPGPLPSTSAQSSGSPWRSLHCEGEGAIPD